jgi:hypothetical protein
MHDADALRRLAIAHAQRMDSLLVGLVSINATSDT